MLDKTQVTNIGKIEIAPNSESLTVELLYSIDGQTVTVTRELSVKPGFALANALKELLLSVASEVRNKTWEDEEVPCATCAAACCRGWDVRLTFEDVKRLGYVVDGSIVKEHLDKVEWNAGVTTLPRENWTGHIGKFAQKEWSYVGEDGERVTVKDACVNLGPDGACQVYDVRPSVCREYSAYECGDRYEKREGKVSLPIVK